MTASSPLPKNPFITPFTAGFPPAAVVAMPRKTSGYRVNKEDSFEKTGENEKKADADSGTISPWVWIVGGVVALGAAALILNNLFKRHAGAEKTATSTTSHSTSGGSGRSPIHSPFQETIDEIGSWDFQSLTDDPFLNNNFNNPLRRTTSTPFGTYTQWDNTAWADNVDDLFDRQPQAYDVDFYRRLQDLQDELDNVFGRYPSNKAKNANSDEGKGSSGATSNFQDWFNANYGSGSKPPNQSAGSPKGNASKANGNSGNQHHAPPSGFEQGFLQPLGISLTEYQTISEDEFKTKYRGALQNIHPDKKPQDEASQKMATEAFKQFNGFLLWAKADIAKRKNKP